MPRCIQDAILIAIGIGCALCIALLLIPGHVTCLLLRYINEQRKADKRERDAMDKLDGRA